jgi:hypothetical protein
MLSQLTLKRRFPPHQDPERQSNNITTPSGCGVATNLLRSIGHLSIRIYAVYFYGSFYERELRSTVAFIIVLSPASVHFTNYRAIVCSHIIYLSTSACA